MFAAMKKLAPLFTVLCTVSLFIVLVTGGAGCANMIPPGGGPKDTIPPILIAETPRDSATNVQPKRITFVFNEFIELENTQENVLFSPTPKNAPIIERKLRTVTVRLRDTLEANTTYAINFGNAIKDLNEGNIFKDFSYVFSTGSNIDVFTLSGKVVIAETGKTDSTLVAILHRNPVDSAVIKETPRYVAKLDGQGNFTFRNLPSGTFSLYAVPNNYGFRFDERQLFAFADTPVTITASNAPATLYAYIEAPRTATPATPAPAPAPKARANQKDVLRYTTSMQGSLDILKPLDIVVNRKVTTFDSTKISLTTSDFTRVPNYIITADTTGTTFSVRHNWPSNTAFNLIIDKNAFADSAGNTLPKTDTLRFTTKREDEYGGVRLRFNNLDTAQHPVLLLVQNDRIVRSVALTQRDWSQRLIEPGDYEIRILFDRNRNGKWDAGEFFADRRQPEVVRFIDTKLTIRANWDNEQEIGL